MNHSRTWPSWKACVVVLAVSLVAACSSSTESSDSSATSTVSADPAKAAQIAALVREAMDTQHLRAAIVRVTVDGQPVITEAFGESMTGVPATTDMQFRNGAIVEPYMVSVLLQLVDEKKASLDDPLSTWLPEVPNSDRVTLGQLATMTAGYHDYVLGNEEFDRLVMSDPFKNWTPEEQLSLAVNKPLLFEPGTNWSYSHTQYVLLGLALEKITGTPLQDAIRTRVLEPLGLNNTFANQTAVMEEPTLHAFSSERRGFLGLPPDTPFYEDSTFWDPSWTIARGAVETTNITDAEATARTLLAGETVPPDLYPLMVSTRMRGNAPVPGCVAVCTVMNERYTYGMGVVVSGDWYLQNPQLNGYGAVAAYLPEGKVSIAVVVTYEPEAFNSTGGYKNSADPIFREIGALMAPDNAPPA